MVNFPSFSALRPVLLLLGVLLALVRAPLAWAGDAERDPARDEARQLARDGLLALQEERFADAIALLRQAEARFHAPTHQFYIARAHAGLGELVEAHNEYVAVAVEEIPGYAPPAFHEARKQAVEEARALRGKIATLLITLEGASPSETAISIDGQAVDAARIAYPVGVSPGEHQIEAVTKDDRRTRQVATARLGQSTTVTLTFRAAAPLARASGDDAGSADPAVDRAGDSSGDLTVAGAVLLAVGGATLVAGGALGGLTMSRADDIEATCGGSVCPTAEQSTVDSAKTLGNVSTALFVVGGVAAAVGVVVLASAPADEPAARAQSPRLKLRASPFGATLSGAF